MLSRALISATVTLLVGCFTAIPVRAENLEAGKSPSQIFAGTCSACHKGMRGLIKTVSPGSLPGFLRQHYTTSGDMAGLLSAYLLSNGASDTRMGAGLTRQSRDAKSEPKPVVAPEQVEPRSGRRHRPGAPSQEAAKPDADGANGEPSMHAGRHAKRLAKPSQDAPEADKPAAERPPAAAATDDTGGRPLSARHKLSKRGRAVREEPPKTDGEAAKTEPTKDVPSRDEATKAGAAKSADDAKSEAAKSEAAKAEAVKAEGIKLLRSDPVPAVTPAPKPSEGEAKPAMPAASIASGHGAESPAVPAAAARPVPPAAEESAPATPVGPPTPPISQ